MYLCLLKRVLLVLLLAFSFTLLPSLAICTLYTYVDENGISHFTTIKPVGKKFRIVTPEDNIRIIAIERRWPAWVGAKPAMPTAVKKGELKASDVFRISSVSVYTVIAAATRKNIEQAGNEVTVGSAVAISSRQLITNCHLFEGRPFIFVKQANTYDRADLVYAHPETDRCYIKTERIKVRPVLGVRHYASLTVGERVYSIGAPRGLENTLGEGLISGLRGDGRIRMIQTSAPISPGSSGGGLFDSGGNLLGITTLYLIDSQNVNFAISAEDYWK